MLRLLSDADVHGAITYALSPPKGARAVGAKVISTETDFVRVQDVLPEGARDPEVLEWAAREDRILLTNDRDTMIGYARQRVQSGQRMPGLIVLPPHPNIGKALDDLELLAGVCSPDEFRDRIVFLPLKKGELPGLPTR